MAASAFMNPDLEEWSSQRHEPGCEPQGFRRMGEDRKLFVSGFPDRWQ